MSSDTPPTFVGVTGSGWGHSGYSREDVRGVHIWMLSLRSSHVYYFIRRQFVMRCHNWLLKYVDNKNRVCLRNKHCGGVHQEVSFSCVHSVVCSVDIAFVEGRHPSDFHDRVTVPPVTVEKFHPKEGFFFF